ncbi:MAG: hypothetical protein C0594_09100 [Marinilabiliales bacterium]|nr:MAG: hypothetical protein C0594_09100 [Marinilabiliales bacterium]
MKQNESKTSKKKDRLNNLIIMKKITLLFIGIVVSVSLFAQGAKTTIDSRASGYYTPEQLSKMSETKIRQVNWLYNNSFEIPTEFSGQIDPSDIDVRKFSKFRAVNEKVKVSLGKDLYEESTDNGMFIYLLSIHEMKEAYNQIEEAVALEQKEQYLTNDENKPAGFPSSEDRKSKKEKEEFEKEQEEYYNTNK